MPHSITEGAATVSGELETQNRTSDNSHKLAIRTSKLSRSNQKRRATSGLATFIANEKLLYSLDATCDRSSRREQLATTKRDTISQDALSTKQNKESKTRRMHTHTHKCMCRHTHADHAAETSPVETDEGRHSAASNSRSSLGTDRLPMTKSSCSRTA